MNWVNRLFTAWTGFVLLFFYLPIGILILFSFNESRLNIVWTGFTFDWYKALLDDRVLVRSLQNSVIVASATTVASVLIGTAGAWLLHRYRYRGANFLETLVFLPMIVPEVILGVSLLILFVTIGLQLGYTTIVISHVTFCAPFVMAAVQARLAGLEPALEEAALDLGATPIQAFQQGDGPLPDARDRLRRADVVHAVARRADRHLLHRQRAHAHAAARDLRAREEGPRSVAQRDLDRVRAVHGVCGVRYRGASAPESLKGGKP